MFLFGGVCKSQVRFNDLQRYNLGKKACTLSRSMRDESGFLLIQSPIHGRKYVQMETFHAAEPFIVLLSLRVKCTCLVVTMEYPGYAIYIPLNLVFLTACIDCRFLTIWMETHFAQCLWLTYVQLSYAKTKRTWKHRLHSVPYQRVQLHFKHILSLLKTCFFFQIC